MPESIPAALIAASGIQHFVELLDFLVGWSARTFRCEKRFAAMVLSAILGGIVAWAAPFRVIKFDNDAVALVITGLVIGSGTEGVNSILKIASAKKEETKDTAAETRTSVEKEKAPNAKPHELALPAPAVMGAAS